MRIFKINTGPIGTNTYIVAGDNGNAFIVDPGGHPEQIDNICSANNLIVRAVLLTHEHYDHCGACAYFQRKTVPVYAHSEAVKNFKKGLHLANFVGIKIEDFSVDNELEDGRTLDLCGMSVRVIYTPGHTSGGVCYKVDDVIFSGDTLFRSDIGRADLPTGDYDTLISSIKNKLLSLDGDYRVLPGHDEETTLDFERKNNGYLQ